MVLRIRNVSDSFSSIMLEDGLRALAIGLDMIIVENEKGKNLAITDLKIGDALLFKSAKILRKRPTDLCLNSLSSGLQPSRGTFGEFPLSLLEDMNVLLHYKRRGYLYKLYFLKQ